MLLDNCGEGWRYSCFRICPDNQLHCESCCSHTTDILSVSMEDTARWQISAAADVLPDSWPCHIPILALQCSLPFVCICNRHLAIISEDVHNHHAKWTSHHAYPIVLLQANTYSAEHACYEVQTQHFNVPLGKVCESLWNTTETLFYLFSSVPFGNNNQLFRFSNFPSGLVSFNKHLPSTGRAKNYSFLLQKNT